MPRLIVVTSRVHAPRAELLFQLCMQNSPINHAQQLQPAGGLVWVPGKRERGRPLETALLLC